MRIVAFINKIAQDGAFERLFRPEGKMSDHVVALPVLTSKLRLYCLRLSDKILILGNDMSSESRGKARLHYAESRWSKTKSMEA